MTREALEAALNLWDHDHQVIKGDLVGTASLLAHAVEFFPLAEAARKQLALMPEMCDMCGGGRVVFPYWHREEGIPHRVLKKDYPRHTLLSRSRIEWNVGGGAQLKVSAEVNGERGAQPQQPPQFGGSPFIVLAAEGYNEEPYELGWCAAHRDVARRWPDGSWGCWWEAVVGASGDHLPSDFRSLWEALRP